MTEIYLLLAIGLIAFIYSSVGHGGASGYLAIMVLYGFTPPEMRTSALILNILVSGIALISFASSGNYSYRKLIPFILGSIPASFLGGLVRTDEHIYKIILAGCLIIVVLRIVLSVRKNNYETKEIPFVVALILGTIIGFISGMIGIGGGILLSPLLIIFRWASIKETAFLSALFILLNSISGLGGYFISGLTIHPLLVECIIIAGVGSVAGSFLGSRRFSIPTIKYALTLVLLFASFKLIFT
jgi:uncharacterized protein